MSASRPVSIALVALLALAAPALGQDPPAPPEQPAPPVAGANPCLGPLAPSLRCPDLVMHAPYDLRIDRRERPGRVLLRAANSIDSVGTGPVELRGRRDGRTMAVTQRIHRSGGAPLSVPTRARLGFYPIPGQGRYWKFRNAARFELWRLDDSGRRVRLERRGPKVYYCFRDLQRRNPSPRSPSRAVYPACNQRAGTRAVTLGTSVGWSDVYPAGYHEQWIDVTGLRGRFAFVHIADPGNGIFEADETNNAAETVVRLPYRGGGGSRRSAPTSPAPGPPAQGEGY